MIMITLDFEQCLLILLWSWSNSQAEIYSQEYSLMNCLIHSVIILQDATDCFLVYLSLATTRIFSARVQATHD